ncbi:MAG TPA: extracellular solute-binding protein [Caldilineaceae bacterium]|nr:extracellular solute-binding protein [Caldilineaceae bacterium]
MIGVNWCRRRQRSIWVTWLFTMAGLLLFGSTSCNTPDNLPDALPTQLPVISAEGTPGFFDPEEVDTVDTTNRQLVLWASAPFEALLDPETNRTLVTVYEQFERNHPGVHIDAQLHAEHGEASLLNYLRSAQRVAPAILPDIILIDTQELWQIGDLELLRPFDWESVASNFTFYPFAVSAVTYQEQIVGIPYMTDLTHMVGYAEQVGELPRTWEAFLTAGQPLNFVAGKAENVNEFAYYQYLGAGELLLGDEPIDTERLLAYFTFLADAQAQNLIPETVLEITDVTAAWNAFMAAEQGLAETSTSVILNHWDAVSNGVVQYGPLPSRTGNTPASTRVWAFIIVASDTQQRELSIALLQALLAPDVHSQWNRLAMRIPTQPAAFELWRNPAAYYNFVQQQLAEALSPPSSRRFADLNRRLHYAQELVLRQEMAPEEAVLYVQATP